MPAPRSPQIDLTDRVLKLTGAALAGASLVFAVNMASKPQKEPLIGGVEHLAIYAQPARRSPLRSTEPRNPGVDYTPVGSISRGGELGDYEILDAAQGSALIRLPEGRVLRIAKGDRIPGLGAAVSIESEGERWTLVTEGGVIREASRNKPPKPRLSQH